MNQNPKESKIYVDYNIFEPSRYETMYINSNSLKL